MIQRVLLSGWALNELAVFGKFMAEISSVKVTDDNNKGVLVSSLHVQYLVGQLTLCLLHVVLRWNINADQNERSELTGGIKGFTVYNVGFQNRRTVLQHHCNIFTPAAVEVETDPSTLRFARKLRVVVRSEQLEACQL